MPIKCNWIDVTCATCGTVFQRTEKEIIWRAENTSPIRYCSRRCAQIGHSKDGTIELICERCGKTFRRTRSEHSRQTRKGMKQYCSTECRFPPKISLVCACCGKDFTVNRGQLAHGERYGHAVLYCSKQCKHTGRQQSTETVSLACDRCGKTFKRRTALVKWKAKNASPIRYCSNKCRVPAESLTLTCATCGTSFPRRAANIRKSIRRGRPIKYCSRSCKNAAVHLEIKTSWSVVGFRPDLGMTLRSTWEANLLRVFKALELSAEYEPLTFRLGDTHYTPDFLVDGKYWVEVKGWMKDDALAKIEAFRAAHPAEHLIIVDEPIYRAIEREWASRIPEWEFPKGKAA